MSLKSYTAPASGTILIPVDFASSTPELTYTNNIIAGTVTLVGGLVVSPIGTPTTGQRVVVTWNASVTPGIHTITIFGETVPTELAARNFVAECLWDGTGGPWVVNILPDFAGVGIVAADRIAANAVTTAKIADDAVTLAKMAGLAKGNIIYGDASGDPASVNLGAVDANLVVGDTTNGVAVVAMSGDATIAKTGALTIAAGVIEGDAAASAGDRNIAAATIEPSNLTAGARKDSFSIRLDFDDASKLGGQIFFPVCYNCTVDAVKATLVGAAGSDLTTIIKDAGGTVMTGSQIDVPSATVVGNVITSTVTGNNTMTAGTNMILEPSAAGTLGGHVHFTFCVTRDN
jgi:hypothetical protein